MIDETGFELPDLRHVRDQLGDALYRARYNRLDFVVLAAQQQACHTGIRNRFIKAGNRSGKSYACAFEIACHALGRYPADWRGRRMPQGGPGRTIMCIGPSNQQVRDVSLELLIGSILKGTIGEAMLPAESIVHVYPARGLPGQADAVVIRRDDGGLTTIMFRSMEMDPQNLQGTNLEVVWIDEILTSETLFNELLARVSACDHGTVIMSATPTRQNAFSSRWFSEPGHPDRAVIRMSVFETTHLSAETVETMKNSFSANERATRLYGDDFAAGGMVLRIDRLKMTTQRQFQPGLPIPLIMGLDPSHGGQSSSAHPSAVAMCAYDRRGDVFYVIDTIREMHISPTDLVARVRQKGWLNVPCAWGHGETQGIAGTDTTFAGMFKALGLRMLPTHSTMPGGGYALDPQFQAIQMALDTGAFKINHSCHELLEEMECLERDERGRVLPIRDDIVSAVRYAWMARKSAREVEEDMGYRSMRRTPMVARGLDFLNESEYGGF